jgi:hypothetical protein
LKDSGFANTNLADDKQPDLNPVEAVQLGAPGQAAEYRSRFKTAESCRLFAKPEMARIVFTFT